MSGIKEKPTKVQAEEIDLNEEEEAALDRAWDRLKLPFSESLNGEEGGG